MVLPVHDAIVVEIAVRAAALPVVEKSRNMTTPGSQSKRHSH
jgi:hypothetical protein